MMVKWMGQEQVGGLSGIGPMVDAVITLPERGTHQAIQ
jgi:hypothetical protein